MSVRLIRIDKKLVGLNRWENTESDLGPFADEVAAQEHVRELGAAEPRHDVRTRPDFRIEPDPA